MRELNQDRRRKGRTQGKKRGGGTEGKRGRIDGGTEGGGRTSSQGKVNEWMAYMDAFTSLPSGSPHPLHVTHFTQCSKVDSLTLFHAPQLSLLPLPMRHLSG